MDFKLIIIGLNMYIGGLAPDDLYFLDLRNGEDNSNWIIVPVVGTTPGRRFYNIYLIIEASK